MAKVTGIDLGTTFSAIAILDDLGNPEVLSDPETNNRITPSVVYLGTDKVIVGDKAKDAAVTKPKNVVKETKRQMENEVVYSKKQGEWIEKKGKMLSDEYTPSQISSFILSKLKGFSSGIKKAVVTVPALFAETARSATLDAAKIAGLEVELINEPTAAILHYSNLPGVSVSGRVLVFDLGGGTFDVTIAAVKGKKVDVITSVGDKELGGADFDREILKIIDKKYKKKKGKSIDLEDKKLAEVAERIKKVLSAKEEAQEIIEGPKGPEKINVTRKEFEDSIDTYIEKIKMLMEQALEMAKCKPENIAQTLLVGGSTRIPIVVDTIKKIMKKAPVKGVNVDEAVACGAAIYAGLQNTSSLNSAQKKAISKVELNDVCNFYMGTIVAFDDHEKRQTVRVNDIIIERNTPLPASVTKDYQVKYDDQPTIRFSVTQSEGAENDIEFVVVIAEEVMDLPKGSKAGDPLKITYSYDKSGKMHCVFEVCKSGKKKELTLKPEGSKSIKELKESLDFEIE